MAALSSEQPTNGTASIEALFRPSTRGYADVRRERRSGSNGTTITPALPEGIAVLELLPQPPALPLSLTTDYVLHHNNNSGSVTFADFCNFLQDDKIVWMAPGVYICSPNCSARMYPMVLWIRANNCQETCVRVHVAAATTGVNNDAATARTAFDLLVRLLVNSSEHIFHVFISGPLKEPAAMSGPSLARLFQESSRDNSKLRKVILKGMILNEEHVRALATVSHPDMQVTLGHCNLSDDDACRDAFIECLQSDRGPTTLDDCRMNGRVLAAAITGNSRVTSLKLPGLLRTFDAGMDVFSRALATNRGLIELNLRFIPISNENWTILFQSLRGHPTLTKLNLGMTSPARDDDGNTILTFHEKVRRTGAVAQMMKENTVLHDVDLTQDECNQRIYAESILPRLETNLYRPRVRAIKKAAISLRRPLLGRALQSESVRTKANLLWMLLSGNPDIVVSSNE